MPNPKRKELTYYDILGISQDATKDEISKAYKWLTKDRHPDRNPKNNDAATEILKHVNEAGEILRDPIKKARYDQELEEKKHQSQSSSSQPDPQPDTQPPPPQPEPPKLVITPSNSTLGTVEGKVRFTLTVSNVGGPGKDFDAYPKNLGLKGLKTVGIKMMSDGYFPAEVTIEVDTAKLDSNKKFKDTIVAELDGVTAEASIEFRTAPKPILSVISDWVHKYAIWIGASLLSIVLVSFLTLWMINVSNSPVEETVSLQTGIAQNGIQAPNEAAELVSQETEFNIIGFGNFMGWLLWIGLIILIVGMCCKNNRLVLIGTIPLLIWLVFVVIIISQIVNSPETAITSATYIEEAASGTVDISRNSSSSNFENFIKFICFVGLVLLIIGLVNGFSNGNWTLAIIGGILCLAPLLIGLIGLYIIIRISNLLK